MSIITLTTDYGLKDYFVGALKGKLLSNNHNLTIVDISHDIDPFNTVEASYVISAACFSFPKGTVHLIGVDLELTKENKHIVMKCHDSYFIAADNGILSMLSQKIFPQKIIQINIHDQMPEGSTDMDVFIKVALHLAEGGDLDLIGNKISSIKEVTKLRAIITEDKKQIKGNVIYIDHFGNVVTNITKNQFLEIFNDRKFEILLRTKNIKTILPNYSAIANADKYPIKSYEGEKLAIFNEAGFLEIAIFRSNPLKVGSAHSLLGLNYSDAVTIEFEN